MRREAEPEVEVAPRGNRVEGLLKTVGRETLGRLPKYQILGVLLGLGLTHSEIFAGNEWAAAFLAPLVVYTMAASKLEKYSPTVHLRTAEFALLGVVAAWPEMGLKLEHGTVEALKIGLPFLKDTAGTVWGGLVDLAKAAINVPSDAKDVYDNLSPQQQALIMEAVEKIGPPAAVGGVAAYILRRLRRRSDEEEFNGDEKRAGIIRRLASLPVDLLFGSVGAAAYTGEKVKEKGGAGIESALIASLAVIEFFRSIRSPIVLQSPVRRRDNDDEY